MGRYRAVVFDMDGTILDTLEDLYLGLNHVLPEHGMPTLTREQVRAYVGNGLMNLMRRATPEGTSEDEVKAVYNDFCDYYAVHCNDHTHPYPGIIDLVDRLHDAGIVSAVVSNKGDFAVQELAEIHFPGVFDAVMGEQAGIPRKPDAAMCNAVLEKMGVSKDEAVYVGDSEVDVLTARNSGLPAIIVTWGFRDRPELVEAGATVLADTVEELEQDILDA